MKSYILSFILEIKQIDHCLLLFFTLGWIKGRWKCLDAILLGKEPTSGLMIFKNILQMFIEPLLKEFVVYQL